MDNRFNWRLSEDFRCAAHVYLRHRVIAKLESIAKQQHNDIIKIIQTSKEENWKKFQQEAMDMDNSDQIAKNFIKYVLEKQLQHFVKRKMEIYAKEYFNEWTEVLSANNILISLFSNAFGDHATSSKALKFILDQKKLIQQQFDKLFKTRQRDFKVSKYKMKMQNDVTVIINEWKAFFDDWKSDIN
eukprot:UN02982